MSSPEGLMSSPKGLMSSPEGLMSSPKGLMSSPKGLMSSPEDLMSSLIAVLGRMQYNRGRENPAPTSFYNLKLYLTDLKTAINVQFSSLQYILIVVFYFYLAFKFTNFFWEGTGMARLWQYLVSISTLFTSSFLINLNTDALDGNQLRLNFADGGGGARQSNASFGVVTSIS